MLLDYGSDTQKKRKKKTGERGCESEREGDSE